MSATSTSNTVAQSVFHILADYDLHHSGNPERPVNAGSPRSHKSAEVEHETPENWPTNHRRVPAYRPVNVHLDRSLRPNGANGVEAMLIATMLNGVRLNAVSISGF